MDMNFDNVTELYVQGREVTELYVDGKKAWEAAPVPVDPTLTRVRYQDGTLSSFDVVGQLGTGSIPNRTSVMELTSGTHVTSFQDRVFLDVKPLSSIVIQSGPTTIGTWCFGGLDNLSSVEFQTSTLTGFATSTFEGASALTHVELPEGFRNLGRAAFKDSPKLSSIYLPSSLTAISMDALRHTDIVSLEVPSAVASVGSSAFGQTPSLTSVVFKGKTDAEVSAMQYFPWGSNASLMHGELSMPKPVRVTALQGGSTAKIGVKQGSGALKYFETSRNGGPWTSYAVGNDITLSSQGDYVEFRASQTNQRVSDNNNRLRFYFNGKVSASGDVVSLLDKFGKVDWALPDYCFIGLFNGTSALVDVSGLTIPTTGMNLSNKGVYWEIFAYNTGLSGELPIDIDCDTPIGQNVFCDYVKGSPYITSLRPLKFVGLSGVRWEAVGPFENYVQNSGVSSVVFDMTGCTSVPSIPGNIFSRSQARDYTVLVPSALYDEWILASQWSSFSSHISSDAPAPSMPADTTYTYVGDPTVHSASIVGTLDAESIPQYDELDRLSVGSDVTAIDGDAFTGSQLADVVVASSVQSVGAYAFDICENLTSLVFLGKTDAEVQEMTNYPWAIEDTSVIHGELG